MVPFKKFFITTLNESPYRTGDFENPYSDLRDAKKIYKDIQTNPYKYKLVYTLFDKYKVFLYELDEGGGDKVIFFYPDNDDFIYGYVSFSELDDGGIETSGVYNQSMYRGLAQKVYNDYLLEKYRYILSSSRHSPDGERFWSGLISYSLVGGNNVYIYDAQTEKDIQQVNHLNDVKKFYGNEEDFERYRIKISTK